jgi:hypothetical protein
VHNRLLRSLGKLVSLVSVLVLSSQWGQEICIPAFSSLQLPTHLKPSFGM